MSLRIQRGQSIRGKGVVQGLKYPRWSNKVKNKKYPLDFQQGGHG